jgi:hypothetical protein
MSIEGQTARDVFGKKDPAPFKNVYGTVIIKQIK